MSKNREVRPVSMEEDVRLLWDSIPTGKRSIIANQILREELPKYLDGNVKPGTSIFDLRDEVRAMVEDIIGETRTLSVIQETFPGTQIEKEEESKEVVEKATDAVCNFIKKMSK